MSTEQATERRCENCGMPLEWKPGEPRRDFLRRIFCDRTCWSVGKRRQWRKRFWAKVDQRGPDECWLWTGATYEGYGVFLKDGRSSRSHILVAEDEHGPRPEGQEVRHLCGVRACVNPVHLTWGTRAENMLDMIRHRGHPQAKLTAADVRRIRDRLGSQTHRALAEEFGVAPATVDDIAVRRTWAWLDA